MTSATSALCSSCFLDFMILTTAASTNGFRSSSTFVRVFWASSTVSFIAVTVFTLI